MDLIPEFTAIYIRAANPAIYGPLVETQPRKWKKKYYAKDLSLRGFSDIHIYLTPSTDLFSTLYPFDARVLCTFRGRRQDYLLSSITSLDEAKRYVDLVAGYIDELAETRAALVRNRPKLGIRTKAPAK